MGRPNWIDAWRRTAIAATENLWHGGQTAQQRMRSERVYQFAIRRWWLALQREGRVLPRSQEAA